MNHLIIVKTLPVTLFRKLVPAFRKPRVILKIVLKACHKCTYTVENLPNERERKPEQKFYAAFWNNLQV
jgi:hypothetical protein